MRRIFPWRTNRVSAMPTLRGSPKSEKSWGVKAQPRPFRATRARIWRWKGLLGVAQIMLKSMYCFFNKSTPHYSGLSTLLVFWVLNFGCWILNFRLATEYFGVRSSTP